MSKPLIGITTTPMRNSYRNPAFGENEPYAVSISAAGGLPVLVPFNLTEADLQALLQRLDGVLFSGGGDIDPQAYGEQPLPGALKSNITRDQAEINLLNAILEQRKPFFGICRGLQLINVTLGGSLYQDLLTEMPGSLVHDNHQFKRDHLAHSVEVKPESLLAKIVGSYSMQVNSLHHQGLRNLAGGVKATAIAPDGLVEAIELAGHLFGLAVQWHPEELPQVPEMRRLFEAFVQACQAKEAV